MPRLCQKLLRHLRYGEARRCSCIRLKLYVTADQLFGLVHVSDQEPHALEITSSNLFEQLSDNKADSETSKDVQSAQNRSKYHHVSRTKATAVY